MSYGDCIKKSASLYSIFTKKNFYLGESYMETVDTKKNDDIYFECLGLEIRKIQQRFAANGMFGTPACLHEICEFLLKDTERYIKKIYDQFMNAVKLGKLNQPKTSSIFSISIAKRIKNLHQKYINILEDVITQCIPVKEAWIEKKLAFSNKFDDKIKILCDKYDALFAEYAQRKHIEKSSLRIAEEANVIAKSSKRASWIFGVISNFVAILAFIIACLTYKK